jgi:hypothetical protein
VTWLLLRKIGVFPSVSSICTLQVLRRHGTAGLGAITVLLYSHYGLWRNNVGHGKKHITSKTKVSLRRHIL